MSKIKEYKKEDLTVFWEASKCIHSEKCWRGLPDVFNPKERPWINVEGASKENIISQVKNCPSGALSFELGNQEKSEENKNDKIMTKVEVFKDGPLSVSGQLEIKDQNGNTTTKEKTTFFCRCGASSNKPYCDGSHKKIDFKG